MRRRVVLFLPDDVAEEISRLADTLCALYRLGCKHKWAQTGGVFLVAETNQIDNVTCPAVCTDCGENGYYDASDRTYHKGRPLKASIRIMG